MVDGGFVGMFKVECPAV